MGESLDVSLPRKGRRLVTRCCVLIVSLLVLTLPVGADEVIPLPGTRPMDSATKPSSEELSATAEELAAQSEILQQTVAFFQLDSEEQNEPPQSVEEVQPEPHDKADIHEKSAGPIEPGPGRKDAWDDEFEQY